MEGRISSFGYWLRRRRKALDLTQDQLGRSVSCSRFMIRKIEADERRPSRRLAERLADTLGVQGPERESFLAAARARRTVERLDVSSTPVAAPAPPQREAGPFVGRQAELELLVQSLDGLASGSGHVVLIEGEPGIGKSRLMRELGYYAHQHEITTLAANCYEIERAMPYQPIIELITRLLLLAPASALHSLPPVSLAEIAALVPAVGQRVVVPVLSADFPEARQARLLGALGLLLDAFAAGRPLAILVDDIHWADSASMQCLHYLARGAASRPLLVLCAYRDEELHANVTLTELVTGLRQERHTRFMALSRLRPSDTKALLDGVVADDLAARLQRETEGNPFYLVSMLHALRAGEISCNPSGELPLPDALRAAVRARLAHVPADVRPVLDVAAVLGSRFDFELLLDAMKWPEEQLVHALESLARRRLLIEVQEGYYDFSHDKVREVVYLELSGTRRMLLHRSVAETLERRGRGELHELDARLAEHFERGQAWSSAVRHMVLAAERSQKLFAMRDALHWFDRAIALAGRHPDALSASGLVALHEQRGRARAEAGQTEGALADIRIVIDSARARGDGAKARDGLILLGMAYRRSDDHDQAIACLTQALEESRALNEDRAAANTLYHLGTVAWSSGRNRQAIECHSEAVSICERLALTDLVAIQAYHGRGEAHFNNLEPAAAIECYNRSIELARVVGDKSYESENLMMIGYANTGSMGLGDYRQAEAAFESALDIARRADLQWHLGPTLLGLGHVHACIGRYGEAWTRLTQTLHWLESLKLARYQLMSFTFIGRLLLDLAHNEKAAEYTERALTLAADARITFWRAHLEANLAIARMRLGDYTVGPGLEATLSRARENDERHEMIRCLEGLAELALRRRDHEGCMNLVDELSAQAKSAGMAEQTAQAHRWRGEALAAGGKPRAAREELDLAAAAARDIGRLRLEWEACDAIARIDGSAEHRTRAAALSERLVQSLEGCGLEPRSPLTQAFETGA